MAKESGRKTYSPETKAEAIRLLFEEGYTIDQTAAQIGCSINSIQKWKAAAKAGRKIKKVRRRRRRRGVAAPAVTGQPPFTFEEFVQNYWSEHTDAADVLRLPPDLAPKAVQYVNNVLRYAYEQLCGQ